MERSFRSRGHVVVAVALVVALVGAGCGSSDDSAGGGGSGGGGGSAGSTQPPPAGTPLKIGWVGTESSPLGQSTQGSDAMDTWVRWTNDHGGINGHPVEVVYADDRSDPGVATAAVKNLVENEKVIAIVGSVAGATQQTWADYVREKRIPVVHGSLIDTLWFTNPMFYPVGGSVIANIWGQMKAAAVAGNEKVGVVLCTEVAACAQAQGLFKANAEQVGMELAVSSLASATQTSYTAECVAAKDSGATALAAFVDVVVMSRDCARQNYHPTYINSSMGPQLSVIEQSPELGKSVGASEQWPCLDPDIEGADDLYAALETYHDQWAPGGDNFDEFSVVICGAWVAGNAFAKAITNAGVAPDATATNEDVIRGLSMFKDETLGGLAPPINFSDGTKPNPEHKCIYLYRWNEGEFETVPGEDALYTCQP